jgi:hypothetical protein
MKSAIARLFARLDLADSLIALGALLVVAGVALVHLAAALVVGGLELVLAGIVIVRRPHGTSG